MPRHALWLLAALPLLAQADVPARVYAHETVLDSHGVIAPWYKAQNGQLDLRARIAAETLKRYPWATPPGDVSAAPHYVFNGSWQIAADGTITIPELGDWGNGDLGQRAAYVLAGLVDYYRYSGDPAAIAHITLTADYLLKHCQTAAGHPWPGFLVSVPVKGKAYAKTDPHGFIQLDITAEVGLALVRAYEMIGERRWLQAAMRWADLLAARRSHEPGTPPWGRYANPEDVPWEDTQTGGVVFVLAFFDELLRVGYHGAGGALPAAKAAGETYLRDVLLPRWTVDDTWGRNYWDWNDPVQAENVTEFAVRYLMEHPEAFPNWRRDCRNIMTLFLNRTSVSPASNGDVYAGAWAYPESSGCCGRSLWYGPMEMATVYAQYGALADSEWAREMARRQIILATYDAHETGVVEDNMDGGAIVAGDWFKIAHPMALKHVLGVMAWLPEVTGASRENHLMRTSAVVQSIVYGKGKVEYRTYDAPAPCVDVLRLAFQPTKVLADGAPLQPVRDLRDGGYVTKPLPGGDFLVTLRHDGRRQVRVEGDDPQTSLDLGRAEATAGQVTPTGEWKPSAHAGDLGGAALAASTAGAVLELRFTGNQVRLLGRVGRKGGLAELTLDGTRQPTGVDCWSTATRTRQVLYYKSGLAQGEHTLKLQVLGQGNPASGGTTVWVDELQFSDASGDGDFGEGGGPTGAQRVILGYAGRNDYVDADGNAWRPGTEFVLRLAHMSDAVAAGWWTDRRLANVEGARDPELYRYGVHGKAFTVYFTVGPGTYHVRLKLCETRRIEAGQRAMNVIINGKKVVASLDAAATAGGFGKAADLVFEDIEPRNGVIAVTFTGSHGGEAAAQAIAVGPAPGGTGKQPVCWAGPTASAGNLLVNAGFDDTVAGTLGRMGEKVPFAGWTYLFAGPSQSYVWAESGYGIHPEWGLPEIRTGRDALRTHTDGGGHTLVLQEVEVVPSTPTRASVWVRAADLHGKGFGASPGDRASLCIQEIGPCDKVLVEHPALSITDAGPYRELARSFTTGDKTVRVRFVLETLITGPFDQGHVTYDDCSLTQKP